MRILIGAGILTAHILRIEPQRLFGIKIQLLLLTVEYFALQGKGLLPDSGHAVDLRCFQRQTSLRHLIDLAAAHGSADAGDLRDNTV